MDGTVAQSGHGVTYILEYVSQPVLALTRPVCLRGMEPPIALRPFYSRLAASMYCSTWRSDTNIMHNLRLIELRRASVFIRPLSAFLILWHSTGAASARPAALGSCRRVVSSSTNYVS
eukprot:scaffold74746_cov18-Prasinocladus_malaysianus.AAC.1